MNFRAIRAIYLFEMARTWRTLLQSVVSPVVSTSLYFVVFGAAIGSRITEVEGVSYGTFIVPGLVRLSVLTQSIANASFGIYFPKFVGTIYEILSAPIDACTILSGVAGGSPRWMASTYCMPAITRPNAVYLPSSAKRGWKQMKNWLFALSSLWARAIDTVPRKCGTALNSALRSGSGDPPVPVPVGSPVCAMKPSITR